MLHEASRKAPHCPQSHRTSSHGFLSYIDFNVAVTFLIYIRFTII